MSSHTFVEAFVCNPYRAALAADVVWADHAQGRVTRGHEGVAALLREFFHDGFPDARLTARRCLYDTDGAALQFIFEGRQAGPLFGLPGTDRAVAIEMVLVCQLTGDELQRADLYYDAGTLLRQLGFAL